MIEEIVYVLLPVHNRRETTERFLRCLAQQTYPHIQLILVDDGSTDDTSGVARKYFPALTLLTGTGDWWWAGSLQQGYKWLKKEARAASDILLIINDDTEFEADFVGTRLPPFETDRACCSWRISTASKRAITWKPGFVSIGKACLLAESRIRSK